MLFAILLLAIDAIFILIVGIILCYFYVMTTIDTTFMLKGDATPMLIVGVVIVLFLCHVNN
jgi:hypothetical protein